MREPSDNETDEKIVVQAKKLFDESVERLDAAALSRLNKGRHAALEQSHGGRSGVRWSSWLPASGVAAAVLISVMVMRAPSDDNMPAVVASDFEILLQGESLEMFEDLEFYSWLDDVEMDTSGNVS